MMVIVGIAIIVVVVVALLVIKGFRSSENASAPDDQPNKMVADMDTHKKSADSGEDGQRIYAGKTAPEAQTKQSGCS